MIICICGGGSLGHVCAGVFASDPQSEVRILTGHPEQWRSEISVSDPEGTLFQGPIFRASSQPEDVVPGSDLILLCLPGYLIRETLNKIRPFVGHATVGSIVSSTGFFFEAHQILTNNTPLFGFQRVPFIARVQAYGSSAHLLGYKSRLYAVIEHHPAQEAFRRELETLFRTPISLLDHYYEAAFSNSNPILHTGRLYSLFHGKEYDVFDHQILFYKEWTDEASDLLIRMDREFFHLLDKLGVKTLPRLLDYYESTDATSLTRKLSGIPAFQTIPAPLTKTEDGWIPDFSSRYFTEDFPFGLHYIKIFCEKEAIEAPTITLVYDWGINLSNHHE